MVQSFNSLGIRCFHKHAPQVLRGQLSSALTRTNPENPFLARFCVQFLLTNLIWRPDFISYKLADAGNLKSLSASGAIQSTFPLVISRISSDTIRSRLTLLPLKHIPIRLSTHTIVFTLQNSFPAIPANIRNSLHSFTFFCHCSVRLVPAFSITQTGRESNPCLSVFITSYSTFAISISVS